MVNLGLGIRDRISAGATSVLIVTRPNVLPVRYCALALYSDAVPENPGIDIEFPSSEVMLSSLYGLTHLTRQVSQPHQQLTSQPRGTLELSLAALLAFAQASASLM